MRCASPQPKSALPLLKHLMLVAGICFGTGSALAEAIPTLDQFFQALDEARSWRAIVKADLLLTQIADGF